MNLIHLQPRHESGKHKGKLRPATIDEVRRTFRAKYAIHPNGCWEWTGSFYQCGYGACQCLGQWSAHRVSWIVHVGEIPPNRWVLHKCDNRKCVNPDHLFLGNRKDNADDMVAKGRSQRGERNGRAILTATQVAKMRRLVNSGIKYRTVASMFRTTYGRVYYAVRDGWKHPQKQKEQGKCIPCPS